MRASGSAATVATSMMVAAAAGELVVDAERVRWQEWRRRRRWFDELNDCLRAAATGVYVHRRRRRRRLAQTQDRYPLLYPSFGYFHLPSCPPSATSRNSQDPLAHLRTKCRRVRVNEALKVHMFIRTAAVLLDWGTLILLSISGGMKNENAMSSQYLNSALHNERMEKIRGSPTPYTGVSAHQRHPSPHG
jgi:hypothetical protein